MSFRHRVGRTRTDHTMKAVTADLRERGYSVAVLSGMGGGIPDLLVGKAGRMWLCEVKTTTRDVLTPDQVRFHQAWGGPPILVGCSADDFIRQMA